MYQPLRLNWANAHARTTLTPNVARNHAASSRRCVGLSLCSERLAQHVFVEREVRDQAREGNVVVLQLPEPSDLAHAEVRELLPPEVERRLVTPICRQTSPTGVPRSTWRKAYAICASEKRHFFMRSVLP